MSEYRLLGPIGRGGMGVVYRAERVLADGMVLPAACKAIHPEYGEHEEVAALFRREAAVALQLSVQHANLVTVYDFYRDAESRLMLAMELVDGVALSGLVGAGSLPSPVIRRVLYEVLQALAYVHDCGVLHRDVSPENILLSKQGAVKLSDFGLSKVITDPGPGSQPSFKGKAPYASPEAIQAQALEPRADLWSIAAVAHELLAGVAPFGRGDILRIFRVQTTIGPAPLPAEVAEDLRALTADLATIDPDARRFQTAAAMLRVLEESGEPMSTHAELGALVQRACSASPGRADDALAHTMLSPPPPPRVHHGGGGPRPPLPPPPQAAGAQRRMPGGMGPVRLVSVALLALAAFLAGMLAGRHDAALPGTSEAPVSSASNAVDAPQAASAESPTEASGPDAASALPPARAHAAAASPAGPATERTHARPPEQKRRAPRPPSQRKPKNVAPRAAILQ